MCEAELAINRRIAPAIFVGVSAVTRSRDGALALGGAGDAVDWVLEMVRFDGAGLFDRLAAGGRLDLGLMRALAQAIASFHRAAERRPGHGGREAMDRVIHGNTAGFLEYGRGILDDAACADVERRSLSASARMAPLLDARRDRGLVRQCHGDLHLRNIVLLD